MKRLNDRNNFILLTNKHHKEQHQTLCFHQILFTRSAARTPSAKREPGYSLRYVSPVYASPSRDTMHVRLVLIIE